MSDQNLKGPTRLDREDAEKLLGVDIGERPAVIVTPELVQLSQAYSLKRIADALDLLAYGDNQHEGVLKPR